MRRVFKSYVLTSDIRVQDWQNCLDWLRTLGHAARALNYRDGGIDFATSPGERKNVQCVAFCTLPGPDEAGDFSGDRTNVWARARQPEWHLDNKLQEQIGGDFTREEINDIDQAIITCLRCKVNVIANERRELLASDSAQDRNNSLNTDYAAAVDVYTTVSDAFPDTLEARLFTCWKCHQQRPCRAFHDPRVHYDYRYHSWFDRVLQAYAMRHHVSCTTCDNNQGSKRPSRFAHYWAHEALPPDL